MTLRRSRWRALMIACCASLLMVVHGQSPWYIIPMPPTPAEAVGISLYSGPHVQLGEFVTGGRSPAEPDEHEHGTIQITILSEHSRLQAEWHSETGKRHVTQVSGGQIWTAPVFETTENLDTGRSQDFPGRVVLTVAE